MFQYAESLTRLIEQFTRLPGIGPKTAQRLAFHILSMERPQVEAFAAALLDVKKKITTCPVCCNLTDVVPCRVCQDEQRSQEQLCIVEDSQDVLAIERTHEYKGLYHVLQGRISPMDGKGPEDLTLKELLDRLKNGTIKEVIIATNPNIEGETTALYLSKLIAPLGLKVTRIAHGVPVGGDLEYADTATLGRAITGRREI
ncbi:MAG TPA: recombination mediator RecR [Peptococcaceae bacterium]|nr:recombination mediator RecR [Peptococcaceae bacterium]HPZ70651.1 recombination mediator RecR [Peptococcaceae bacterium]HQD54262.1 recombination mediator RecR [Peptococcaceae bacterium]